MCICILHECVCAHACVHSHPHHSALWRSEDSCQESAVALFSHQLASEDAAQVRCGGELANSLSHLIGLTVFAVT